MRTIVNNSCPHCGSEEVVDTKRHFVDHLTDTEAVANLKKCDGDHNYRFYPEGVYDQIWLVGSDWGREGSYGSDWAFPWGFGVKDKLPLLFEKIEYNYSGFGSSLKRRKGIDPSSIDFPEDFETIEANVSCSDKYEEGTIFLDFIFSLKNGDGSKYRWAGHVTPSNEVRTFHRYTDCSID